MEISIWRAPTTRRRVARSSLRAFFHRLARRPAGQKQFRRAGPGDLRSSARTVRKIVPVVCERRVLPPLALNDSLVEHVERVSKGEQRNIRDNEERKNELEEGSMKKLNEI